MQTVERQLKLASVAATGTELCMKNIHVSDAGSDYTLHKMCNICKPPDSYMFYIV